MEKNKKQFNLMNSAKRHAGSHLAVSIFALAIMAVVFAFIVIIGTNEDLWNSHDARLFDAMIVVMTLSTVEFGLVCATLAVIACLYNRLKHFEIIRSLILGSLVVFIISALYILAIMMFNIIAYVLAEAHDLEDLIIFMEPGGNFGWIIINTVATGLILLGAIMSIVSCAKVNCLAKKVNKINKVIIVKKAA